MKNIRTLLFYAVMLLPGLALRQHAYAQCCTGTCTVPGPNLVTNGNFSLGNTGFASDHAYQTGIFSNYDQYGIYTTPQSANPSWSNCGDHTTGSGNMMVVDGSITSGDDVWRATFSVQPNTDYCFSFFATRANSTSPPRLFTQFNGTATGSTLDLATVANCTWAQLSVSWNSGSNTSVTVTIENNNTDGGGNDFAIDDISMTSCLPRVTANAGADTTLCKGSSLALPIPAGSVTWSYKQISGTGTVSGNTVSPIKNSVYVLTVVDPVTCCKATDTIKVTLIDCCACPNTCFTPGPNKIVNGDFSSGNTGFTSQYVFNGGTSQSYWVDNSSAAHNTGWNKNGNPGNFFIGDGATSANVIAWSETMSVVPGATYTLCFDYINLNINDPHNPIISVRINGVPVGSVSPVSTAPWTLFTFTWTANAAAAVIQIVDNSTSFAGNDFGLDNISFRQCKPSAGPDTLVCNDFKYTLPVPEDPNLVWTYKAISGDMSSLSNGNIANPQTNTTYILTVINPQTGCSMVDTVTLTVKQCCPCPGLCYVPGNELIVNGTFEAGNTGFSSQYVVAGGSSRSYWIDNSSNTHNVGWNKNGNPNNFFIGDGSTLIDSFAWRETVPVNPNSRYTFCMDYINLAISNPNNPVLDVRINGVSVGTVTPNDVDPWNRFTITWSSGAANIADIRIYDNSLSFAGNDFGLDNISFRECKPKLQPNAGPDTTICKGASYNLPKPTDPAITTWFYNAIDANPPFTVAGTLVTPKRTTTYVLEVHDATGCVNYDTVVVFVRCCYCVDRPTAPNLLINADFNAGNTGFTSMYTPGSVGIGTAGNYWVQPVSTPHNPNWDKAGNPGNFLFADGSMSPGTYVWSQNVPVTPNTNYSWCMDIVNLNAVPGFGSDPAMAVYINGSMIGSTVVDEADGWMPVSYTWNSGPATTANIAIMSLNTTQVGNDFGIDNLGFSPCNEGAMKAESMPTGSAEPLGNEKGKVQIYPNPANNEITVKLSDLKQDIERIMIIDISGKTVKNIPAKEQVKMLTIPISELQAGTYTVAVYGHSGCIEKRMFVKM